MLLLGLLKVVTSQATQPSRHKVFSSLTCLVLGDENLPDFNSHNDYPLQALTGSIDMQRQGFVTQQCVSRLPEDL